MKVTVEEFEHLKEAVVALIPSASFEEDVVSGALLIRTDVQVEPVQ